MTDYQTLYINARERIEELEEEVRQLRSGVHPDYPQAIKQLPINLTGMERHAFAQLLAAPPSHIVTRRQLEKAALSSENAHKNEYNERGNMASVIVHHLRRKLGPFGISIRNAWGQGYFIDRESREKWSDVVDGFLRSGDHLPPATNAGHPNANGHDNAASS